LLLLDVGEAMKNPLFQRVGRKCPVCGGRWRRHTFFANMVIVHETKESATVCLATGDVVQEAMAFGLRKGKEDALNEVQIDIEDGREDLPSSEIEPKTLRNP
jgi:hypothetical protein